MNETILRMLREARETKDVLASAAVFIRGVPGLLREAILKALDANKNLTEADLAEMAAIADELDAGQAVIVAAIAEGTLAAGQPLPDGLSIAEREALKGLPIPTLPLPPEQPDPLAPFLGLRGPFVVTEAQEEELRRLEELERERQAEADSENPPPASNL